MPIQALRPRPPSQALGDLSATGSLSGWLITIRRGDSAGGLPRTVVRDRRVLTTTRRAQASNPRPARPDSSSPRRHRAATTTGFISSLPRLSVKPSMAPYDRVFGHERGDAIEVRGGAGLELRLARRKQRVAQREHETAVVASLEDLGCRCSSAACCAEACREFATHSPRSARGPPVARGARRELLLGRFRARDDVVGLRAVASRVRESRRAFSPARSMSDAPSRSTSSRQRAGGVDLAVGDVDAMRGQREIFLFFSMRSASRTAASASLMATGAPLASIGRSAAAGELLRAPARNRRASWAPRRNRRRTRRRCRRRSTNDGREVSACHFVLSPVCAASRRRASRSSA